MANRYNLLFLNAFLILSLAGCAVVPPLPASPETFVLRGKVAVREAGESFSANLLWHQRGEGFEIDLWGPLGQGRLKIVKEDEQVRLSTPSGVLSEGEPEALMRGQLGWSLPIDVLPAWVQGEPLAGVAVEELTLDAQSRVAGFRQLGWTVALERYEPVGDGFRQLPRRITASRDDARVRLVIAEWQLGAAG